VCHGLAGGHPATFVAGEPDRQQTSPRGFLEGAEHVAGISAGREPNGDVPRTGMGDQLAGENDVEADVIGQR
jgi:hypothetical protein